MTASDIARRWMDNMGIVNEWAEDYARRTGKRKSDVLMERCASWIHDGRAEVIGTFDGFKLSACPLDSNKWRFTVETPWYTNEGLCDTEGRDAYHAIGLLHDVIEALD